MPKCDWTILVYTMADEAGLRRAADRTLSDIESHADSAKVKTVAQVTLHSNNVDPIRRYDFEHRAARNRKIDRQNKGLEYMPVKFVNPRRNLVDFLEWGQRTYPARRYCVVLQGHAWGADYSIPSLRFTGGMGKKARHTEVRLILGTPQSKNHLSNKDLQQSLTRASRGRRFAILGMDSCLMSMAEICYELRQCADYTIAPEGLGPVRGWPFTSILRSLARTPSMTSPQFGMAILESYSKTYRQWAPEMKLTASLCSLKYSGEFVRAMKKLVQCLRDGLRDVKMCRAIIHARVQCDHYHIPTYVDLFHFCQLLMRETSVAPASPLFQACAQVQQALRGRFVESVFLKRRHRDAYGLSIFFPGWKLGEKARPSKFVRLPLRNPFEVPQTFRAALAKIDAAYADHEFADQTGWKIFLLEFIIARLVP